MTKLSSAELRVIVEKLKGDMEHTKLYLDKLRDDKAKMSHSMLYCLENVEYLRTHVGIVRIDYLKKLKDQISRMNVLIKNSEYEIKKFEISLENQAKSLDHTAKELEAALLYESNKIVQIRRKR